MSCALKPDKGSSSEITTSEQQHPNRILCLSQKTLDSSKFCSLLLHKMSGEVFKLTLCACLTCGLMLAELILGHFSHCLTLLALTNQTMYNLLTLLFAIVAKKLRHETSGLKSTFGWARLEVLGSLSSLVFLGSLSFATSIESLQTLFHSGHLDAMHHTFGVCVLAGIHFLVWIVVFVLIGGYSYQQSVAIGKTSGGSVSLHLPSAKSKDQFRSWNLQQLMQVPVRHVFRDLIGCILLLAVATISFLSQYEFSMPNLKFIDPCVALVAILILILSSWTIAKESGLILLQTIPAMLDVDGLKAELFRTFPSILNIHEMHIWCLVPGNVIVTMHVIFKTEQSYRDAVETIEKHLSSRGVTSFTIQPEILSDHSSDNQETILTDKLCLLRCKGNCKNCC